MTYLFRAFDQLHEDATRTISAELRFKHQEAMRAKLVRDLVESRQHIRAKVLIIAHPLCTLSDLLTLAYFGRSEKR